MSFPLTDEGRQTLAEDTSRASRISTTEAAGMQPEEGGMIAAGEVLDRATLVTMEMSRAAGTQGTAGGACARDQINDGPIIVDLDREYTVGGEVREEVGGGVREEAGGEVREEVGGGVREEAGGEGQGQTPA